MPGCPIQISTDHIVCADPRSFSQLITSFFASESLGIPHTPFSSLSPNLLIAYLLYIRTLYYHYVLAYVIKIRVSFFLGIYNTNVIYPVPICQ